MSQPGSRLVASSIKELLKWQNSFKSLVGQKYFPMSDLIFTEEFTETQTVANTVFYGVSQLCFILTFTKGDIASIPVYRDVAVDCRIRSGEQAELKTAQECELYFSTSFGIDPDNEEDVAAELFAHDLFLKITKSGYAAIGYRAGGYPVYCFSKKQSPRTMVFVTVVDKKSGIESHAHARALTRKPH